MTLTNQSYFSKSFAELHRILRDASEAAESMRGVSEASESKYLEQVNDACTVLNFKKKNGHCS